MVAGIHKSVLIPPLIYEDVCLLALPAMGPERSKHPTSAAMRLHKASREHCRSASLHSTPRRS